MIYFIRSGDYVKIGRTIDPKKRTSAIRCHCPTGATLLLTLDGDHREERRWHRHFAAYHHRAEWFHYTGNLARFVCVSTWMGELITALEQA